MASLSLITHSGADAHKSSPSLSLQVPVCDAEMHCLPSYFRITESMKGCSDMETFCRIELFKVLLQEYSEEEEEKCFGLDHGALWRESVIPVARVTPCGVCCL